MLGGFHNSKRKPVNNFPHACCRYSAETSFSSLSKDSDLQKESFFTLDHALNREPVLESGNKTFAHISF